MELNDPRLIMGLLKEALFSEKPLTISSDDQDLIAFIDRIDDVNPRVLIASKSIVIRVTHGDTESLPRTIDFKIQFPRFVCSFKNASIKRTNGQLFEIECPESASAINKRSKIRVRFQNDSATEVVLHSDGLHSRSEFTPYDHNTECISGFLKVRSDHSITPESRIFGRLPIGTSYVTLYSRIVGYSLLDSNTDWCTYRVVLENGNDSSENQKPLNPTERRSDKRTSTTKSLTLIEPENLERQIEGTIENISLGGFTWKPLEPDQPLPFPVGTAVFSENPRIHIRLLGRRPGGEYAFEVIGTSTTERHSWMELVYDNKGLNLRINDSEDVEQLLSLFIGSGALAAGYVNENRGSSERVQKSLLRPRSHYLGLVHRWRLSEIDDSIDSVASAFRVSDIGWMIGDIAATIRNEVTPPGRTSRKEFISSFISSFARFCETLSPCPELFILFSEEHPFWQSFIERIRTERRANVCRVMYTRFSNDVTTPSALELKKVRSRDWADIRRLGERLEGLSISPNILDARTELFGSPHLRASMSKISFDFERHIYRVVDGPSGYLVINKFPPSLTLNQTVNCAWYIPDSAMSLDTLSGITAIARMKSLEIGSSAPGLIIPSALISNTETKKHSLLVSGHPEIFGSFFEGLENVA